MTKKPSQIEPWDAYVNGVIDGSILACLSIKLACERHRRDIERSKSADSPYFFDPKVAIRACHFFSFLTHYEGEWAGKSFKLEPWQAFCTAMLFGWKRKSDKTRRFRSAYIAVPRKNGKTTWAAGIGLYCMVADDEPGAQVYSFATTRDQAKIVFNTAGHMRKASAALSKRTEAFRTSIHMPSTSSTFIPLSSEDKKLDGLNAHLGIADELHQHPTRALWDVVATSGKARRQPLMIAITTSGTDKRSFCATQHDYSEKVLAQIVPDESFFCFVAQLDEGDNWEDERNWYKANPNLGKSVKIESLRLDAERAKNDPTALNAFLRYSLNVWTTSETRAILPDVWKACAGVEGPCDPQKVRELWLEQLVNARCYGGLDLAWTTDIAAEVLYFPKCAENPHPRLMPFFFVPEERVEQRAKRDRVPYDVWIRQGFLIPTPGNVIDYDFIRQTINQHKEKYQVIEIGYDPFNARQLVSQLLEDGLPMVEIRQGYLSMNSPSKDFMRMILSAEVAHGNNPVLTWMADNLVFSQDPAGCIKPDKEKAKEKIDGIVAAIMAIGRATAYPPLEDDGDGPVIWALGA